MVRRVVLVTAGTIGAAFVVLLGVSAWYLAFYTQPLNGCPSTQWSEQAAARGSFVAKVIASEPLDSSYGGGTTVLVQDQQGTRCAVWWQGPTYSGPTGWLRITVNTNGGMGDGPLLVLDSWTAP